MRYEYALLGINELIARAREERERRMRAVEAWIADEGLRFRVFCRDCWEPGW